jgi:hypothetical protein
MFNLNLACHPPDMWLRQFIKMFFSRQAEYHFFVKKTKSFLKQKFLMFQEGKKFKNKKKFNFHSIGNESFANKGREKYCENRDIYLFGLHLLPMFFFFSFF